MSSAIQETSPDAVREVELSIGGMTCASCAARIERKLNKVDGVTATVNFATEKAKVAYPTDLSPDELVKTVEAAGYTATVPQPDIEPRDARDQSTEDDEDRPVREL